MMDRVSLPILAGIFLAGITFWSSFFVLPVTEKGVLLQFGEVVNEEVTIGLNFKIPFIQSLVRFTAKVITVDTGTHTYLTKENEVLEVDSVIQWRVQNQGRYYRSSGGDERRISRLLQDRVDSGLRNEFGKKSKSEVVSEERDDILNTLLSIIRGTALDELGVEVVDVRINRIELPETARNSVHRRMAAERQRLANEARAEGREISDQIKSQADKEQVVLIAEARREAEIVKGEGDAEATRIYGEAFRENPALFDLWRSLNSYKNTFKSKKDLLILSPNNEYFRYLSSEYGTEGDKDDDDRSR